MSRWHESNAECRDTGLSHETNQGAKCCFVPWVRLSKVNVCECAGSTSDWLTEKTLGTEFKTKELA